MLSRVWVERAGSESAVFGGARPLSDLVDMPIDTVYMSMDMPCHATLCYACAFSLSPPPSLSFPLSPLSLSLSLSSPPHLFVLIRGFLVPPSCSSLLVTSLSPLFLFPRNFPSLSLFRSVTPSSSFLIFPSRFRQWLSGRRRCGCVGRSTLVVVMVVVGECGGGSRWRTGETRGQGMTVVECSGWRRAGEQEAT